MFPQKMNHIKPQYLTATITASNPPAARRAQEHGSGRIHRDATGVHMWRALHLARPSAVWACAVWPEREDANTKQAMKHAMSAMSLRVLEI